MTLDSGALIGRVSNPGGAAQWLRFGIPVSRGFCDDPARLQLVSDSGDVIDSESVAITYWNDGSLQWALVDAVSDRSGAVHLRVNPEPGRSGGASASRSRFTVDNEMAEENPRVRPGNGLSAELRLSVSGSPQKLLLTRKQTKHNKICNEHVWQFEVAGLPDLRLCLHAYEVQRTGQVELKVQVHNSAPALHPNGCWDLGDPNSLDIDDLALALWDDEADQISLLLADQSKQSSSEEGHARSFPGGQLFQYGSGGENWDSPVHLDKCGSSTVTERGFRLCDRHGVLVETGLRAMPQVRFERDKQALILTPQKFWENFPASLELEGRQAVWHLFPQTTELQPGEAKTWLCDIGLSESRAGFTYQPEYIDETGALLGCKVAVENELSDLLDHNLSGPGSFYRKREDCDEFGWRNFGELYADHEALKIENAGIFVSHYNNQYDPVWGFSLRYLGTGDERWHELASDLARHVVDIDIYKTDRDKAEYNNGLFWHTDHYLPALTATHRTYSRDHNYAYEGHQGGGGPGGQHCYPSGLALNYLLSGDEELKQAVVGLSTWIRSFYNGAPGVLARLHRLLTVDLKTGEMTNVGYIEKGYKYPLDRGTGHYLNTLIDTYLIGQDSRLLDEMFGVIIETVSPYDDPGKRDLANAEEHWFYIVFLQSLARYLLLKEQLGQADREYAYARHTLNHYGYWILANEKPYLANPDALEFPTDTWAAQDIRKANVLYYSAYFNTEEKTAFTRKADEFWAYCVETLRQSPERHTTRVQAIVAQNLGVREWVMENGASPHPLLPLEKVGASKPGTGGRFASDILRALRSFSVSNEIAWLKGRLAGR